MELNVIQAGLLSSVQDGGRWGYQAQGVSLSGYADTDAATVASLLVRQPPGGPVLEAGMGLTRLQLPAPVTLAVTGAGTTCSIGGEEVPCYRPVRVWQPCELQVRVSRRQGYLALAPGINAPVVLGSASWQAGTPLGLEPVQAGQRIPLGPGTDTWQSVKTWQAATWGVRPPAWTVGPVPVRIVPGPAYPLCSLAAQTRLAGGTFTLSPMMSRMGLQLAEKLPDAATLPGMLSSPATRGHIQATPDGTLIVLQADAQPTGGYPLIGWVCEADQALLARLVPGDQVRFVLLTAEAAEALYLARAAFVRQLTAAIRVRYHFDQLRYGREFWGLDPGT